MVQMQQLKQAGNNIYGIIGNKGHGKDTLAKYIKKHNDNFYITHFADHLKEMIMRVFDISYDQLYTKKKEELFSRPIFIDNYIEELTKETGLDIKPRNLVANTPRELMQFVGTDYVREEDSDYWINRFLTDNKGKDFLLCADIRFKNESEAFRLLGAKLIRIYKKNKRVVIYHSSEDFSDIDVDYNLYVDDGSIDVIDFAGFLIANNYINIFSIYSKLSEKIKSKILFRVIHFLFKIPFKITMQY